MLGLSLGAMLQMKANASPAKSGGPGWDRLKVSLWSICRVVPSHMDLWDPNLMLRRMSEVFLNLFQPKFPGLIYRTVTEFGEG